MALSEPQIRREEGLRCVLHSSAEVSEGKKVHALTGIHEQQFPQSIGGVRIVNDSYQDIQEVRVLAQAMTYKCALANIPADGEKTVLYCDGTRPASDSAKAELVAQHLSGVIQPEPGVIFGPDMFCGEQVIERLAHHHDLGENVTGLPSGQGGLSIDERGFTAFGLTAALLAAAEFSGHELKGMSVAVQGFGAVGAHTARLLHQHGLKVVAINTKAGCLHSSDGLNIEACFQGWQEGGDEAFAAYQDNPPPNSTFDADSDIIFQLPADVFVPAARVEALSLASEAAAKREQGPAFDVEIFLQEGQPKIILEGANGPLTPAAELLLEERGLLVLPDYLVNHGGLVGCWYDWIYRSALEEKDPGSLQESLEQEAISAIQKIAAKNVHAALQLQKDQELSAREATRQLAMSRLPKLIADYQQAFEAQGDRRAAARALSERYFGGK